MSREARRPARTEERFGPLVGKSPAMRQLYEQMEMVAPTDASVLIEGETGTGKDLVARTLHRLSERAHQPFVAFNASNLQDQLFESELFGHRRGAFSGAHDHHEGLARAADGGTLFIDEVGELPQGNQAKLLRFLDSKEVRSVGSTRIQPVDVRILCATNRDLRGEVKAGNFRQDLYYRLRVITLKVPSLAERREDLALLIDHFLHRFADQYGKTPPELAGETRELLLAHCWEGNVRELENEIERAVVLTPDGGTVCPKTLSDAIRRARSEAPTEPPSTPCLKEYRRSVERTLMIETLERTGWNVTAAAKELDISRVGLTKKMKRLGVKRPEKR